MEVFPLPASVRYDYARAFDRGKHEGTDIFAPKGTPVLAVVSGLARTAIEPKGGKVVYLEGDDARTYYFAHLDTWSLPLMARGSKEVETGEVIGQVGSTGNAEGKAPHVHLQVKLRGRNFDPFDQLERVDPKRRGPGGLDSKAIAVLVGLWWLATHAGVLS